MGSASPSPSPCFRFQICIPSVAGGALSILYNIESTSPRTGDTVKDGWKILSDGVLMEQSWEHIGKSTVNSAFKSGKSSSNGELSSHVWGDPIGCTEWMRAWLGNPLLVQCFSRFEFNHGQRTKMGDFPTNHVWWQSLQPPPSFTSVALHHHRIWQGLFGFIWFYSQLGHRTQAKTPCQHRWYYRLLFLFLRCKNLL